MLTAQQARQLAGPTVEERVEDLLVTIEKLAKERKRECRCGWDHKSDDAFWTSGGYSGTPDWKTAKTILEELGYKVTFYYREHSVAVDMYTLVQW